jgi:putative polyketide hydroxylase
MDVGRQGDIGDVDGLGEFEAGVKSATLGQGGDDPGLAGVALPPDLRHELSGIGIDLGGGDEDVHDLRRSLHEVATDTREGADHRFRICLSEGLLHLGPVAEGDGLVVTTEGDVEDALEERPLGGEQAVQGWQRGVSGTGDRFEGGSGISVLDEEGLCCFEDAKPGVPGLGLAARIVVAPLDRTVHIRNTITIMTVAELSRNCEILVVGAGPAGLVAGITLARYGVDVLVIDKRDGLPRLSRNLVISTRGMELMRRFGLEEATRAGAADVKISAWVTPNLASGDGTEMPVGYPSDAEAAAASPTRPAWASQDHHEPILLEHLRRLAAATVQFGWELLEISQGETGVRATVADAETGRAADIHASYVIAADGAHSLVRDQLGIRMIGPEDLADYERVEFCAPLWQLVGEHRHGLYVITRPDAAGVLAPRGSADRWGLSRETPTGTPDLLSLSQDDLAGLIQRAAGMDGLRPRIERVSNFSFAAQMAERYAEGRCFLVGDAAHRMTPRGGTGMNTAIQDSFDLGWKLAWVLRGWAGPGLLATYEHDRRPVAAHNVQRASEPTGAQRVTDQALPWDLNGRLPHHWLACGDEQTSTIDLIGDGLTVLAGPSDPRWARFAASTSSTVPIDVHVLDGGTADALDVPPSGALLARPDGRPLRRWTDFDSAVADWPIPKLSRISAADQMTLSFC